MDEDLAEKLRGFTYEKLRELCSSRHIKVHGKNKEEMVGALSQIEGLNLEDIITPTGASTGHAGKVEAELTGQMMKMMLEMQREQRQWMEMQQEKQQKWMEMQEKRHDETRTSDSKPKLPRPTLQKLTADDDIESYLQMFERVATQQSWPEDIWATQLAGLLTGDALDAFTSVPLAESNKYKVVKAAILSRFDVNAETYRQRFRRDVKKPGESFKGFLGRLDDKLMRWSSASGLEMKEMILLEQFLETLPPEMRVRVMERKPSTAGAAADIADDLDVARQYESDSKPPTPRMEKLSRQSRSASPTFQMRSSQFRIPPRPKTNTRGEVQCWACEGWGHIAANCPDKLNKSAGKAGSGKVLFNQGQTEAEAPCSQLLPNFEVVKEGTLDDTKVKVLLDTGSQTSVARADLVAREKWDSETKIAVRCVHGDSAYYPSALVRVGIDGVWKVVRVALIPEMPVDLLIGVNDLASSSEMLSDDHNLMVMTRQQKRHQMIVRQENQTTAVTASPTPLTIIPVGDQSNSGNAEIKDLLSDEDQASEQIANDTHNGIPADEQDDLYTSLQVTPEQLQSWQESDVSLKKLREAARNPQGGYTATFFFKQKLLYRRWVPKGKDRPGVEQLVLPVKCRSIVLRVGHDVPAAGHMGINKTRSRILRCYYWPGVFQDIARYCKTCEVCQRSARRSNKARMIPMPIITTPFHRIAMDIVGPLPKTRSGNKYVLTICDYATKYPEAIPLPSIEAERIARELVIVFSRMGIPKEILTDQGTNFMSTLLQEVYQLLNITRIRTSPYHPQTDGLVERFNGTLKSMMKKFTSKSQKDWDECLPYLLFAYREAVQESTGFAPFELLYGRHVRGPLEALRESWTGEEAEEPTTLDGLSQIRARLEEMSEIVEINMKKAQRKQKHHYDKKARECSLEVGDEVLVKIPSKQSKLKLEWEGPYRITRKVSSVDYEIETPGKRKEKKVYHVNLLKKWNTDTHRSCAYSDTSSGNQQKNASSLATLGDLHLDFLYGPLDSIFSKETCSAKSETSAGRKQGGAANVKALHFCTSDIIEPKSALVSSGTANSERVSEAGLEQNAHGSLSSIQKADLQVLFQRFPNVLGEKLGRTKVVEHHIETEAQPIRQHPYRVPITMRETVKAELDSMANLDIIQPSRSPWASPVVLVEKKDGGLRFCVDYRKLNDVSKFDAYPMPRVEDVLEGVGSATVFSTLDLCKGYWQVPMEEKSREKTAFTTPFGLFEFKVMPFGLHNAPATFQRMMDEVLKECQDFAKAYIDDVVIFSNTWEEHLHHLGRVFQCLQKAGLTLKQSKCQFGLSNVYYLGYLIGGGGIQPDPQKVEAVLAYKQPETKSEVSAFLGLTGYYRKFIPSYASKAAPLTELLKKGKPERILWSAACTKAFVTLKECLIKAPILRVPDPSRRFIVQTDASDVGIGAVLSQLEENGEEHPIAYASRKLQPRETKYSAIEKECLAIVWALKYFKYYLYGQAFTIYTDHKPLTWLNTMKNSNQRLTRWILTLQEYRYEIHHRPGTQNKNADGLSRGPPLTCNQDPRLLEGGEM